MKRLIVLLFVINVCILLMKNDNRTTVIYVTNNIHNNFIVDKLPIAKENSTKTDLLQPTEKEEQEDAFEENPINNSTNDILLNLYTPSLFEEVDDMDVKEFIEGHNSNVVGRFNVLGFAF